MKGFHDWKVKLKPKAGDKLDAALVPNEKIVEVASTPPGADVMLDGKRVGKTPYTIHKLDLTKAHELEVKRAGFVSQTRSISATDTFEAKGDKDVLAVAMTLEAEPKAVAAPRSGDAGRTAKPEADGAQAAGGEEAGGADGGEAGRGRVGREARDGEAGARRRPTKPVERGEASRDGEAGRRREAGRARSRRRRRSRRAASRCRAG